MSDRPEYLRAIRQWVEKAEHDLRTAVHTLTLQDECPFDTVCFHCQQCAEKYLKALLVALELPVPRTHDLRALMELMAPRHDLGLNVSVVATLNRYTVEARYPGDWEEFTRPVAERAVATARSVREAVRTVLPKGTV